MATPDTKLEQLQNEWKEMFQKTLPESSSQINTKWPVHVAHCFARIILDSTVGIDTPWMEKIKSPAYMNMSREQLESSIELGRKILTGEVDLVKLDKRSLSLRGKGEKASGKASGKIERSSPGRRKRKADEDGQGTVIRVEEEVKKRKSEPAAEPDAGPTPEITVAKGRLDDLTPWLKKIALSDKSLFQKKVLTALCQVPRGRYTTYAAISKHLSSSPRAVGNALRNNPFAPQVPCHRVLASGGGLGGFHGSWGRNGKEGLHDDKKRKLLREEGVGFDGKGRVISSA